MNEKTPVLYTFRRCPYAMRARLALIESGCKIRQREILLKDKPACMLAASPKGTVPVLILPNGQVIDESLDIMIWALNQNDPDHWLDMNKKQAKLLIDRNDTTFKAALDRYKYPSRYPDEDCSGAWDTCFEILRDLNDRLENSHGLVEDRTTLADMAIFPFVRQCAFVRRDHFEMLKLPHLQRWLGHHLESKRFGTAMKKVPVWENGQEPVYLGSDP
ncbi:MAG: glutathione S-transferase [Rhodospirillales bacterium]|nr:glutathione S-transferase [Rhodospirillales bacterium]MCB9994950.1 glutathione S-transferase [Rhodospirillales bacterium]